MELFPFLIFIAIAIYVASAQKNAQRKQQEELRRKMQEAQQKTPSSPSAASQPLSRQLCEMGNVRPVNGSTEGQSNYHPMHAAPTVNTPTPSRSIAPKSSAGVAKRNPAPGSKRNSLCEMGEVRPVDGSTEGQSNYETAQLPTLQEAEVSAEEFEVLLSESELQEQRNWRNAVVMAEILAKPKCLR